MDSRFSESLRSSATVTTIDGSIVVATTTYVSATHPVSLRFGPLSMGLTPEKAIELGSELIAAAHHWRAALAEYQQAMAAASTQVEGGAA